MNIPKIEPFEFNKDEWMSLCSSHEPDGPENVDENICRFCSHYLNCYVWNNEEFKKNWQENRNCELCNQLILDRGLFLILWKFKRIDNEFKILCCHCFARKKKLGNLNGVTFNF